MIEPDLAKLIDHHDRFGERRVGQQLVEQGGLTGTEKAGQHGERDGLGRRPQPVCAADGHFFLASLSFDSAVFLAAVVFFGLAAVVFFGVVAFFSVATAALALAFGAGFAFGCAGLAVAPSTCLGARSGGGALAIEAGLKLVHGAVAAAA